MDAKGILCFKGGVAAPTELDLTLASIVRSTIGMAHICRIDTIQFLQYSFMYIFTVSSPRRNKALNGVKDDHQDNFVLLLYSEISVPTNVLVY